jgi:hypothetical protein
MEEPKPEEAWEKLMIDWKLEELIPNFNKLEVLQFMKQILK